ELDPLRPLGELRQEAEGVAAPGFGDPDGVDTHAIGDLDLTQDPLAVLSALPVECQAKFARHARALSCLDPRTRQHVWRAGTSALPTEVRCGLDRTAASPPSGPAGSHRP